MSGIAGIFNRDGRPVEQGNLKRMLNSIAHRGPHGTGVWVNRSTGFGHCLLHTTPESLQEKLPLTQELLTITCDARIDNRDELFTMLDFKSRPHSQITDSDVILAAYEKWGDKCVTYLLGDFVFAIWDAREQKLFCARDHFGVKPFIYYLDNRIFVFASEAKALSQLSGIPCTRNESRIADYLSPDYYLEGIDKTSTFFSHFFRLPPATAFTITYQTSWKSTYWSLDPERELKLKTDQDYAEAFNEIFTEAVRCRLRSATPVVSMLSGGLDSGSIVCVARDLLKEESLGNLITISAVSDDENNCVEAPFLNQIISGGYLNAHKVKPSNLSSFIPALDNVLNKSDDLFDHISADVQLISYASAHKQGSHVVLDGGGGDLITSGRSIDLSTLLRQGKVFNYFSEAIGQAKYYRSHYKNTASYPMTKTLLDFGILPCCVGLGGLLPKSVRTPLRSLLRKESPKENTLLNPSFANQINLEERLQKLDDQLLKTFANAREAHYDLLSNSFHLLPGLERYERLAASQSVEPRHPFIDRRLVEFCLALPEAQKRFRGWTKITLRRAMKGILPEALRWRTFPGTNLMPLFYENLRALKFPLLQEIFETRLENIKNYLNTNFLNTIWRQGYQSSSITHKRMLWDAAHVWLLLKREHLM